LSLFDELRRRKVFRVAIAYVIGAWVFAQVAALVADVVLAQAWVMQVVLALLVVGLPISLILAWVFDLTPEGIIRAPTYRGHTHRHTKTDTERDTQKH